jgi:hypothetical protein
MKNKGHGGFCRKCHTFHENGTKIRKEHSKYIYMSSDFDRSKSKRK